MNVKETLKKLSIVPLIEAIYGETAVVGYAILQYMKGALDLCILLFAVMIDTMMISLLLAIVYVKYVDEEVY